MSGLQTGRARAWLGTPVADWAAFALLILFVLVAAIRVDGLCLDIVSAIRNPLELDYGEGIVWQQAALIPGPRMYGMGAGLPFIVFHYPPLFHLLARAALPIMPDFLAAGRLVAGGSTLLFVPLVAGLVLIATPPRHRLTATTLGCAVGAGLLALCLVPVRNWAVLMRVDMPGVAFGMAGLLIAARTDGRLWGTITALLLCVAAVFTKQTFLSFGAAVFLMASARRPREALLAALVAGGVAVALLIRLQVTTGGGFLHHLLGYNINRFSTAPLRWALHVLLASAPVLFGFVLSAVWLTRGIAHSLRTSGSHGLLRALRDADPATARRTLLVVHFALASFSWLLLFKTGGAVNYLLEWLCSGCVLLGLALADLGRAGRPWTLAYAAGLATLVVSVAFVPQRQLLDAPTASNLAISQQLVERIRAAQRPVASANMVLLMRAGQGVVYEPAIVTELAHVGLWDETPLVQMIRRQGFEFMLTSDGLDAATDRRTPGVNAAMWAAYPRLTRLTPGLWLHEVP